MKTPANIDGTPEIEWGKGFLKEKHDHESHYGANGISSDGRTWIGTWIIIDGHINEIHDIEEY
jgi:hypothetical protein